MANIENIEFRIKFQPKPAPKPDNKGIRGQGGAQIGSKGGPPTTIKR